MSQRDIVLHATPPLGSLPASDVESLHLVAVLQFACPGRWAITSGEWSTNGVGSSTIHHVPQCILLCVAPGTRDLGLGADLLQADCRTSPIWAISIGRGISRAFPDGQIRMTVGGTASRTVSWKAYIEGTVTDVVVAKPQLDGLRFPENHYIPQRTLGIVKTRLSHVKLWGVGGLHNGPSSTRRGFRRGSGGHDGASGMERVVIRSRDGEEEERVGPVLDPLARRLGREAYFFGSRYVAGILLHPIEGMGSVDPRTRDLLLLAHLALILTASLSDTLLLDLIRSTYLSLLAPHDRTLSYLFGSLSGTGISTSTGTGISPWTVVPCITLPPRHTLWQSLSSRLSS
ncbi:LOW QUALITY PROTEIN: hypothetical protein JCM24511_06132 [Saitozyma sp. JCM 24511]|nr:LOW QUALITY PROTEIN: hypothetical protein JCM24511_06132 [Saitozyma sp. JCM 24511]